MKFSRSFRSGLAGLLALIVLIAIWIIIIDERCSKNVSDDETSGMVQAVPFGGGRR